MTLEGKSAIVTGAGRGIGRTIALRLARDGADVLVAELRPEAAQSVAREVQDLGRRGVAIAVDVTRAADRARMVETAVREFGKIDILVNNAGILRVTRALEITEEEWQQVMAVNATAVFFCSQAVIPEMQKHKSGKIISLASQAGKGGHPLIASYNASKAAVISITRSLAMAVAADGINVNCVCPGVIDTDMGQLMVDSVADLEGVPQGAVLNRRVSPIPLGRMGTPEDVARVVGFLASSDSDYMTGQAVNVTGGLMLH